MLGTFFLETHTLRTRLGLCKKSCSSVAVILMALKTTTEIDVQPFIPSGPCLVECDDCVCEYIVDGDLFLSVCELIVYVVHLVLVSTHLSNLLHGLGFQLALVESPLGGTPPFGGVSEFFEVDQA